MMHSPRAFSLIEILIAVLILAIGMLSLGAVFPIVVIQQRTATDSAFGVTVGESARRLIEGMIVDDVFWTQWRELMFRPEFGRGEWARNANSPIFPEVSPTTGSIVMGDKDLPSSFVLPVSQRLYPSDPSGRARPQFVWDIAIHRVVDPLDPLNPSNNANNYADDQVEVVVFVRRLDGRIDTPRGQTLWRVLTDKSSLASADRRVPVGVDTRGLPTNNGTGEYAGLLTMPIEFDPTAFDPVIAARRDRIVLIGNDETANTLLRSIGQKFVDNLGNVFTVVNFGRTDDGDLYVQVNPPVPRRVLGEDDPNPPVGQPGVRIEQAIFSPQTPASVLLFKVTP